METSDSECFESADEDFYSEDDNEKVVKEVPVLVKEIKKLTVKDEVNQTPLSLEVKVETKNKKKPTTVKMKNKLGVRIDKSDVVPIETQIDNITLESIDKSKKNEEVESEKEVNMWEDDNWEPIDKVNEETSRSGWIGWGNWGGVTALLSTATAGVTTITNHVSQGLSTVLETGIGAPDPEELARINSRENTQIEEPVPESSNLSFGLSNFVSGVSHITKLVETTGNKVISGGLDTLETIGKKTMEVLQDGDPGLLKKRAFLKIDSEKPVLSHILREAKEKAELKNQLLVQQQFAKTTNYESLFDDHQGLVHLEALEMLSKQCDIKLQTLLESLSGDDLVELQETLTQIEELCELIDDDEELEDMEQVQVKLDSAVAEMHINISYNKLLNTWKEAEKWLDTLNLKVCSEMELHEQAIDTLAQITALAVERYHKIGELLLIKEHRSTADEADSLVQLTTTLTMLIGNIATKLSNKLSEKLTACVHKDELNDLITNVYFESANSSLYMKNAFQLLIPVLQVGAI
ncbi:hypothetical protein FQA39_LY09615 [Lamprigera yunnana]|nr:hypothetical protein FQA39_LY09615 [Lamprigera yunnana]